jgi:predicted ATPase
MILLDDLQWGDALTVALIDDILQELHDAPLFVLALARPELHEVFPSLWSGYQMQEIALKPLSKKACERLIQQVLGKEVPIDIMAHAVEQSGGNALFLEELILAISEGNAGAQSETVIAMLQVRIGRLETGPRRVIRAAAILGETFWQSGIEALLVLATSSPDIRRWLDLLMQAEPRPTSGSASCGLFSSRRMATCS